MSSIKLLGETSGEVVLKAPAVAGASEVTLPTGTVDLANYMTATYTGDLDITGNGTFSGDLTVDTSTLKVDSTNNRVGIGNATPTNPLHIIGTSNDTIDETQGTMKVQASGGNGMILGTIASSPYTSYIQSAYVIDTSLAQYNLVLNPIGGNVGIGTTSPNNLLDVSNTSGNAGMSLSSSNSGTSYINFADTNDPDVGQISYVHSDNSMRFKTNDAEDMRLESDGDLHVDGDVIAFSTTISDVALKSDIEMIPNALDKIDEVRGVTFTRHNGQKSAGIIAQELEKVLPEAVREKELKLLDGKKYKTVEYDAIHGLLINCIKELKEEIKELKNAVTK